MTAAHRRYPLLVLLSVFTLFLTAWNCAMIPQRSGVPFSLEPVNRHEARIVRLHSFSLPPGLHAGDRVEFMRQDRATRMDLLAGIEMANTRRGHAIEMVVTHQDGSQARVRVPVKALQADPALRLSGYIAFAWLVIACLITLVTLWRGRDRAAWGIALWAIAFQCGAAFVDAPAFDQLTLAFGLASQIAYLVARIGFFVMAYAIAAPALGRPARKAFVYAFAVSLALGYAYELTYVLLFVYGATLIPQIASLVWVLPYAVAAALLMAGYRTAAEAERPRLRWMSWSSVVMVLGILLSNAPLLGFTASDLVEILAYFIAFSGLLYSVLRHRVVDMSIVINRAIVYSVTLTIVVGIFTLLESFLEKLALSQQESLVLELAVPLIVGLSLEALRKRLERLSERLLFRQKFNDERALRAFARQCAFIEHPDHLLEQTLRELHAHTRTPAAAVYWQEQGRYRRLASSGAPMYPLHADVDDRAFVSLRAERQESDLEGLHSELGGDGLLLPMTVRGDLLGAVVTANRPGEHYPQDERELLAHLVHEVGSALHALHARENARFVAALADGGLSGPEARQRARVLAQSG